jgi:hypothetical protein
MLNNYNLRSVSHLCFVAVNRDLRSSRMLNLPLQRRHNLVYFLFGLSDNKEANPSPRHMIFLLDESNIHRQTGLSSIALVCVKSLDELERLDQHVLATEQKLRMARPFHWNSTNPPQRMAFIDKVLAANFQIRFALLANPINIWRAIESILPNLINETRVTHLIIDGSKPRSYTQELKKVLRDQGIHITTLRTEFSRSRPSLRVADCVANIARLHAEQPSPETKKLYALIRRRIEIALRA